MLYIYREERRRKKLPSSQMAGHSHASLRTLRTFDCLCGKDTSRSLKKPTSSQYFLNLVG
jgi:hypothetical protein